MRRLDEDVLVWLEDSWLVWAVSFGEEYRGAAEGLQCMTRDDVLSGIKRV